MEDAALRYGVRQLQQMVFIYNAVMDGWSVKRVRQSGNFRFKKRVDTETDRREYASDTFLHRFLSNMQRLRLHEQRVSSFEVPPDAVTVDLERDAQGGSHLAYE